MGVMWAQGGSRPHEEEVVAPNGGGHDGVSYMQFLWWHEWTDITMFTGEVRPAKRQSAERNGECTKA